MTKLIRFDEEKTEMEQMAEEVVKAINVLKGQENSQNENG